MNTLNKYGRISKEEEEKYSVLRHRQHNEICQTTGCGMTTIERVLKGLSSAKTEKAQLILKEADKVLKSMK
jgi:hypothetical protein